MKGSMKIEVNTEDNGERIEISTRLSGVDLVGKVRLLSAICDALEVNDAMIMTMMCVREELHGSSESVKVELDDRWRKDK